MPNRGYILNAFNLVNSKTQNYVVPEDDIKASNVEFTPSALIEDPVTLTGEVDQVSMFGTLVFSDMTLKDPDSDLAVYFDTVLLSVTGTKNVIKTAIQGRDGTVKEYIANGDYSVTVRGALVNTLGFEYPEEDVKRLIELVQLKKAVDVTCPFLQLFNIYQLVIESDTFAQKEGFQNTQFFEFECISDVPIELIQDA